MSSLFTTGLFSMTIKDWGDALKTAAFAECQFDLFNQVLVRFTYLFDDGVMSWFSNMFLRQDRLHDRFELILDADNIETTLVHEWLADDIDSDLLDFNSSDPAHAFDVLVRITADYLYITPLSDDDIARQSDTPLLDECLKEHGRYAFPA